MITPDTLHTILTILAAIAAIVSTFLLIRLHWLRVRFEEDAKKIQERQTHILSEMSDFGRAIMDQTLKIAPQFAFSPYQQLLPSFSQTNISLFDRRRSHFSPEKEELAEFIVRKIAELIDKESKLYVLLILDSGSTVYPVFRRLCLHPSFQFDKTKAERVKLITNNLPGVSDLIRYGRIGDPVHARTLFKCRVLSGYAHSQYEATLSDETATDLNNAIVEFKNKITKDHKNSAHAVEIKVVCVTTGNYISIKEGVMARDKNHVAIKNSMLELADVVYVLSPLGKLLPYSCDEINELLEFRDDLMYATLPQWQTSHEVIHMVVTTRRHEYFPQLKPIILNTYFSHVQGMLIDLYKNNLHTVPFDPTDDVRLRATIGILGDERALREYELPHQNLREKLMLKLQTER